jgi:hypothetical protein
MKKRGKKHLSHVSSVALAEGERRKEHKADKEEISGLDAKFYKAQRFMELE